MLSQPVHSKYTYFTHRWELIQSALCWWEMSHRFARTWTEKDGGFSTQSNFKVAHKKAGLRAQKHDKSYQIQKGSECMI